MKNLIIVILSATLIVLFLFSLSKPQPKPPLVTAPKVERVMDTVYTDTLKFHKENEVLKKQISRLGTEVKTTKAKLTEAERMVNDILNSLPVNDTTELLKRVNNYKDSLISNAFLQLDSIIALKDSQFVAAQELKDNLLKSVDQLAKGSLQKDDLITYWKKQAKKQKLNKILYKIATGVAAVFIIKQSL